MLPEDKTCTGCGSCSRICPYNCITMKEDAEGFRYPVIDSAKCIHCGLCERSCPVAYPVVVSENPYALAAQNKDDLLRENSSSGGIFSALAMDVLSHGGKVCAAVFDSEFSVCHAIAESEADLVPMRGAKYTQSQAEHCFPAIKAYLDSQIPVLFVGTPCQTAGLLAYLGYKDPNLLLVDMVCHGVPSPEVWKRYLSDRISLDAPGSKIRSINLRSKATGWSRYSYSVAFDFQNGAAYHVPQNQDQFMQGFLSNLYLRPSCSNCSFKGIQRCSDMTLGDYWGIWDQYPDFDDNKGTSLLLIHTDTGKNAWSRISGSFRYIDVSVQDAISQNPSVVVCSQPHPNRQKFFRKYTSVPSLSQWIGTCLTSKKENLLHRIKNAIRK